MVSREPAFAGREKRVGETRRSRARSLARFRLGVTVSFILSVSTAKANFFKYLSWGISPNTGTNLGTTQIHR